ncbi:MAG TPA: hypothetical protein RMH99_27845 [Sandaracinaceae bacterium LLY-WYZ-13_1]|nr:hypothetical protein [Sandaracinaceae bacterium LLY-WYZ-13_1]
MTGRTDAGTIAARVNDLMEGDLPAYTRAKLAAELRHPAARDALLAQWRTMNEDARAPLTRNPLLADAPEVRAALRDAARDPQGHGGWALRILAHDPTERELVIEGVRLQDRLPLGQVVHASWEQAMDALVVAGLDEELVAATEARLVRALATMRRLDEEEPTDDRPGTAALDALLVEAGAERPERAPLREEGLDEPHDLRLMADAALRALARLGPTPAMTERLLRALCLVSDPRRLHPAFSALAPAALLPLAAGGVAGAPARLVEATLPGRSHLLEELGPRLALEVAARCREGADDGALQAYQLLERWNVEPEAREAFRRAVEVAAPSLAAGDGPIPLMRFLPLVERFRLTGVADALAERLASGRGPHHERCAVLRALGAVDPRRAEELFAELRPKDHRAYAALASLGTPEAVKRIRRAKDPGARAKLALPDPETADVAQGMRFGYLHTLALDAASRIGADGVRGVAEGLAAVKNDFRFAPVRDGLRRLANEPAAREEVVRLTRHEDPKVALLAAEALDGVSDDEDAARAIPEGAFPILETVDPSSWLTPSPAPSAGESEAPADDPSLTDWASAAQTRAGVFAGRRLQGANLPVRDVDGLKAVVDRLTRSHGVSATLVAPGDPASLGPETTLRHLLVGHPVVDAYADQPWPSEASRASVLEAIDALEEATGFWAELATAVGERLSPGATLDAETAAWLVCVGPLPMATLVYGVEATRPVEGLDCVRGQDMEQVPHEDCAVGKIVASAEYEGIAPLDLGDAAHAAREAETEALRRPKAYHLVARYD